MKGGPMGLGWLGAVFLALDMEKFVFYCTGNKYRNIAKQIASLLENRNTKPLATGLQAKP
jgi:hypothetical protein